MTGLSPPYRIVRYSKADRVSVFAFLRVAYREADIERLIQQWDWKYDANPFNPDGNPYVLLLKADDEIIGMLGAIPLRVAVDGVEHLVSHSCDWVVRPDHRDRHLARRLTERHRADRPLRFAWQNATSNRLSQVRADTSTARIVPLVKPMDVGYVVERAAGHNALGRLTLRAVLGAHGLVSRWRPVSAAAGVSVSPLAVFDERFDTLWRRAERQYPVMVVRDRRYLDWRFGRRPDARYSVLTATAGTDLVGYLVLRVADEGGVRSGYLVDFLLADGSATVFARLVADAVERLRAEGVKAISCRATVPTLRRVLRRYGFYPFPWGPRGYLRTNVNTAAPAAQRFGDIPSWHLTMGDGDIEMAF